MLLVPTVVALYKAHVERLARINAAAIRVEPKMVQLSPDQYSAAIDAEREKQRKFIEGRRVAKELAAEKKRAKDIARGIASKEPPSLAQPTPFFTELLMEVSRFYDISTVALKSARRDAPTVLPRQIACYIAYKDTGLTFPHIGRLLGNRDHTTILHAVRKIENLLAKGDENLAVAIITIKLRLRDRVQARIKNLAAIA